jgi:bacteriocin biosynthesis cyclodehydratase domain-containing protein
MYGRDVRNVLRDRNVSHDNPSDPMGDDALVVVVGSRPALTVALELDGKRQAFVPVWGYHGRLQIGPIVAPGGPCFSCYEARERQHASNLAVHDSIREYWLRAVVPPPTTAVRALTKVAANEIGQLHNAVTKGGIDRVPDHLLGVVRRHSADGEVTEGRVVPTHGCSCGQVRV